MKKHIFIVLFMVFWITACVGSNTQTNQELTKQASAPYFLETSTGQAKGAENTATPISDTTQDNIPLAISWFQEHDQGLQIVSLLLGTDIQYPVLDVEDKKTIFLGPAAIDSLSNLYLIYGYKDNYISKLSPHGNITSKLLPFDRSSQALWLGEKLVLVPISSTKPSYIIDTSLNITEVTPSMNAITDATNNNTGFLGIADVANNLAIWVFTRPVQTDFGFFAHYRTLDLNSGKTFDGMLPIPAYKENSAVTNDPTDRLGTEVVGVDPFSKNVLLCYGQSAGNNSVTSILALYSSELNKPLNQEQRCCMNNKFDLRGDTFIQNHTPESCSGQTIQNWSDMSSAIDIQQFLTLEKPKNDWILSNGIYWVIKTNQGVAVFNPEKSLKVKYNLPDDLPHNLNNADTFQIGLLMIPH